jgi:hypothetical protein
LAAFLTDNADPLSEDIDPETFTRKHTEFPDWISSVKLQLDVLDLSHDIIGQIGIESF